MLKKTLKSIEKYISRTNDLYKGIIIDNITKNKCLINGYSGVMYTDLVDENKEIISKFNNSFYGGMNFSLMFDDFNNNFDTKYSKDQIKKIKLNDLKTIVSKIKQENDLGRSVLYISNKSDGFVKYENFGVALNAELLLDTANCICEHGEVECYFPINKNGIVVIKGELGIGVILPIIHN